MSVLHTAFMQEAVTIPALNLNQSLDLCRTLVSNSTDLAISFVKSRDTFSRIFKSLYSSFI